MRRAACVSCIISGRFHISQEAAGARLRAHGEDRGSRWCIRGHAGRPGSRCCGSPCSWRSAMRSHRPCCASPLSPAANPSSRSALLSGSSASPPARNPEVPLPHPPTAPPASSASAANRRVRLPWRSSSCGRMHPKASLPVGRTTHCSPTPRRSFPDPADLPLPPSRLTRPS